MEALLADNVSGDISPQDIRDGFKSYRSYAGQLYVAAADAAAVTIPDTTNYVECSAPVWTELASDAVFDESDGNGRLTYVGAAAVMVHLACTISFTCVSNNQVLHFRLAKNGTTVAASEVIVKIGTGADARSTAIHLVTSMAPGDHISLWVRNETSAADVTVIAANMQGMTMPV